jgi:hypothetical protein
MADDLLTRVQRELDERLEALRPLVDEARQLEEALDALDAPAPAPAPTTAAPSRPARRVPRIRAAEPASPAPPAGDTDSTPAEPAANSRTRISREQADDRRRQALAIITENPGTTASTLALLLDTSTGTMHSLLKRLEAEGEVEKAEKGFARLSKPAEQAA